MKTTYNKLVRDNIPEIINKKGRKCNTKILSNTEYKSSLIDKLYEEIDEFKDNQVEEELADIFEVLEAIISAYDFESMHIDYLKLKKKETRGGFENKIFLIDVED